MDENKTKAFLDKKYADLTKGVLVEQSASIDQEPIAVTKEDEDGDFICELNISPPDYDICNHIKFEDDDTES